MEKLSCYSALYNDVSTVLHPNSVEELKEIFTHAKDNQLKLTFRAGGHSFDRQALGRIVVSMDQFNSIQVDVGNQTMTVGAGTTWGDIFNVLEPEGFVPFSTVTTRHATAGGTLSADCLSRCSPRYGKEGHHVNSFEFLTLDGQLITCTPPVSTDPNSWSLGERIFCGAISGFGYLGAVISINYNLLYVGQHDGKIQLRSTAKKYTDYRSLAQDLIPIAQQSVNKDPTLHDALFSGLFMNGQKKYAMIIQSDYDVTGAKPKPMGQHQPYSLSRLIVEFLMRSMFLLRLMWPLFYKFFVSETTTYYDDLQGYTFFMDGNLRAKNLGQKLGLQMKTLQQTFVIPAHSSQVSWDQAEDHLVEFLETAHQEMDKAGLVPALFDVLFLPQDDRFYLSPSNGLCGFAISYAFETSNKKDLKKAKQCMESLSDVCLAMHGKVSLVKNVFAKQETLEAMYSDGLPLFRQLKQELDPNHILSNEFFDSFLKG